MCRGSRATTPPKFNPKCIHLHIYIPLWIATKKMSDEYSEVDEIDFNSEIESTETISNASFSPPRPQDANLINFELPGTSNITKNLFRREVGKRLRCSYFCFIKSKHDSN